MNIKCFSVHNGNLCEEYSAGCFVEFPGQEIPIGVALNTQLHTCKLKIATFKGGYIMWQKWFLYYKELLIKERIRPPWEQILFFKRSFTFEKGCSWRELLFDPVVSLWCAYLFQLMRKCHNHRSQKGLLFSAMIINIHSYALVYVWLDNVKIWDSISCDILSEIVWCH